MSASPSTSPNITSTTLPPSNTSRSIKRARGNLSSSAPSSLSLSRLLETLSADSLRSVLKSLTDRHPSLTQEITSLAPRPLVSSTIQVLKDYQTQFNNSFPLGDNPSSDYAYNRTRPFLVQLLDALNDFTPHFLPPNEPQTATSLNYLDATTSIIHSLPTWDSPRHNIPKNEAYEAISGAWAAVIREGAKRGGGMLLQYGGWDEKIRSHNHQSGGKMNEAVRALNEGLSWMGGGSSGSNVSEERQNIRQQLFSGTYGMGAGTGGGVHGIRTGIW